MMSWKILLGLVFLTLFAIEGLGQVDTYTPVLAWTIEASGNIAKWHFEDLNRDGMKDIVVTTASRIEVFDSPLYQLAWSSPELPQPRDLEFQDLNHDGYLDIAERDSSNIRFFNPFGQPELIWTSPVLDSTYRCYTVGKVDEDNWPDLIIARKEIFTRINDLENRDTLWVEVYSGPLFGLSQDTFLTCSDYHCYGGQGYYSNRHEQPSRLSIVNLTENSEELRHIMVHTTTSRLNYSGLVITSYMAGLTYLLHTAPMDLCLADSAGYTIGFIPITLNDTLTSAALKYAMSHGHGGGMDSYTNLYSMVLYRPDWGTQEYRFGTYYSEYVPTNWTGYSLGELIDLYSGPEIVYSVRDSVIMRSVLSGTIIWSSVGNRINHTIVKGIFRLQSQPLDKLILATRYPDSLMLLRAIDFQPTAVIRTVPNQNLQPFEQGLQDYLFDVRQNQILFYSLERLTDIYGSADLSTRAFSFSHHPNPFNSYTIINYELPDDIEVDISIYDIAGRQIRSFKQGNLSAGKHQIKWDASDIPAGIYFARLQAGEFCKTIKMILLK